MRKEPCHAGTDAADVEAVVEGAQLALVQVEDPRAAALLLQRPGRGLGLGLGVMILG